MVGRSRLLLAVLAALLPVAPSSCALGGTSDPHVRTVLVDYHFDQFAAVFDAYFPRTLSVHPGDTVVFKQAWNGEPHTVTMGTLVDDVFGPLWPILKDGPPFPAQAPDTPGVTAALKKFGSLPAATAITPIALSQQGAQPCLVATGYPGSNPNAPCEVRTLVPFNGRQAFYNSGVISSETNLFRLPIASDTAPGRYHYYCTVHGPMMSGELTVVAPATATPSQAQVNQQAMKQLDAYTRPMIRAFSDAQAGRASTRGNLAGVDTGPTVSASIAEFVPRTIHAKTGEKVTWHVVGDGHTISFDVPSYLPEITTDRDGAVQYNPKIVDPIGAPGFPPPQPQLGPDPLRDVNINAGAYDGSRFLSSGLGGGGSQDVTYSVTFTRPGRYKYACLVHPLMVGEVDVGE